MKMFSVFTWNCSRTLKCSLFVGTSSPQWTWAVLWTWSSSPFKPETLNTTQRCWNVVMHLHPVSLLGQCHRSSSSSSCCVSAFCSSYHEDPRASNHSADLQLWEDGLYRSQEVSLTLLLLPLLVALTLVRLRSYADYNRLVTLFSTLTVFEWGTVTFGSQEIRPGGAETRLPRSLPGL